MSASLQHLLWSENWSLADLHRHLGGIPLNRICANPPPGGANVQDVTAIHRNTGRLYELIDGILVEKTMGYYESRLAILIAFFLEQYLSQHDLGIVLGADGTLQILPNQVRIPDVSFIAWQHFPNRELPAEPIPKLAPDLAVEILSESNTAQEIARKLRDYFASGTALVWIINLATRTAQVFSSTTQSTMVSEDGQLTAGELLPGFTLSLSSLFNRAGKRSS